jgi:hypothetical protein
MNGLTRSIWMSAGLCLAVMSPASAELDVAKLKASIEASVEADYPKLDALYKDIHAHPEVAFQEVRTAAKLAAEMRALGFEVTEKIGKTGLVAIYKNKRPGLPMRATTRPTGTDRRPSSTIAAATIFTWRLGSGRPKRWSA